MTDQPDQWVSVPGVRLGTAAAGIRFRERDDLVVLELPPGTSSAAVFTRNAFCAAPVLVARRHLEKAAPRFLLINAGNANAGTGGQGIADAEASCAALAALGGCRKEEVLPFSTGVIGEHLPVGRLEAALPGALERLQEGAWPAAARAIMTTDTVPKLAYRRLTVVGRSGVISGIAKGSGMIRPDMATMLAFLATDIAVAPSLLQACLRDAVAVTFNAITVDGDTSTNDACVLSAAGTLGNPVLEDSEAPDYGAFRTAAEAVCADLAAAIVRDGEGATKLVTVLVEEARDPAEARRVADAVAHSPLVKTALFASDPNWGRVLAAVGRAGVDGLDIDRVGVWLGDVRIVSRGGRDQDYTEQAGREAMVPREITIRVTLGRGAAAVRVLTCDLSYDYVRINAEYRT